MCPRDRHTTLERLPVAVLPPRVHWQPLPLITTAMKDFANASFPPEVMSVMDDALDAAAASLPEPVSSTQVQFLAEAILRAADRGERDPIALERLALLELRIRPR